MPTSSDRAVLTTPRRPDLDALVDATPASRDRLVDLLRVVSVCVVVLWHWSLSLTHWRADGVLVMPNPVADVPGGWAATWVLQVMPVFFVVGGYANLAGWQAVTRDGGGTARFLSTRMRRLLVPLAPWLAVWVVVDAVSRATGGRGVLEWGAAVLAPLWFLGVYVVVVALVPLTARAHRAWGWRAPAALFGVAILADVLRLGAGWGGLGVGLVGSAAVWLLCHQLGYLWRDGTLLVGGRRRALAVAAAGLGGLVALTALGPYPVSMVAVQGDPFGNMFPTTAVIAALATFQLGLALLARPRLDAWLRGRRPWRAVVAANGLAMPVFVWHMTALVVFLWLYELAGFSPQSRPTVAWWLERPVWVVGPGLALAGLLLTASRLRSRPHLRPDPARTGGE